MKTTLKKWHIALMSFIALFISVFASLFSLRADTVDEETGEVLTDNWELGVVFYDSTVDNGKTPLTEINWDASDGSYKKGTPRVITVQINYKNNSAVTTYLPGELEISIPNLIYNTNYSVQWISSAVIGANDETHIEYDWFFSTASSPTNSQPTYTFKNTNTIEEKSNFEGSIQIQYSITPREESSSGIYVGTPNWASKIERYDSECTHNFEITLKAILSYNKNINNTLEQINISSNNLYFYYTRTYVHPWEYRTYTIEKTAEKISSLDGLGVDSSEYLWVKYKFTVNGNFTTNYPYIGTNTLYIEDVFPSECIVKNENMDIISPEIDNSYRIHFTYGDGVNNSYNRTVIKYLYVGYPKIIYNENNNNLTITNTANLYGLYAEHLEYSFLATDNAELNLNEFVFTYEGDLYSISKTPHLINGDATSNYKYSQFMTNLNYTGQYIGSTALDNFIWNASVSAIYTGTPMTIRYGDDLLYITDANNNYRRLTDDEYYFSGINIPYIKNGNNVNVSYDTYVINLYLRYANQNNYSLYKRITNEDITSNRIIYFSKEDKVVGYYLEFQDFNESCIFSTSQNGTRIKPLSNISIAGSVHNFNYLQIFFKNDNGDLILQNPANIDNYDSFICKNEISTFDQSTYNVFLQRGTASFNYLDYTTKSTALNVLYLGKSMSKPIQNASNELFAGSSTIKLYLDGISDNSWQADYFKELYFDYNDKIKAITNFKIYDLLPEGMELDNENFIESFILTSKIQYIYNIDGERAFNNNDEFQQFLKEHTTINIVHNWRNTNRTLIKIDINFSEYPLYFLYKRSENISYIQLTYQWNINYDAYMQFGQTWINHLYAEGEHQDYSKIPVQSNSSTHKYTSDSGFYDKQAKDINENGNTTERLAYNSAQISIVSVISTHQDVTTYVQTNQSNYSTGIVDASNNSEYEYKLRVRTGSADVTNLVIYSSIEEAQPNRTRWKGKFLGIDTSYAKNKGYNVKSYYSENPSAGNLYNENGTFNNNWKEYIDETTYKEGLMLTFNNNFKTENIKYDYIEIYYKQNGKFYNLGKWGGTDLAGQTVSVPTNDFYLYWHTDGSSCSYYGFSIDSVEYTPIENNETLTEASLPSYPIEETTTLPDSAFDSYTHGNYGNSINKLWHYTYSGEKELIKEATDKTKVKSLAFEYLDTEGNPAVLPANSLTYVLIKMKAPADESIKTLARMDCWTQWNAIDEFDRPVDFITGINSNVVKVALPNSVKTDDLPSISLKFTKEIQGTETQFENMKLDKAAQQLFMLRLTDLTANEDGSYNQITALLKSNQELIISQIPVGTYLLEELGDNYFDFVEFTDNNDSEIIIEGVTFERTNQGYIITVSENLSETIEFNIKVTNKTEDERFYEDKDNKENLFLTNREAQDI